MGESPRAQQAGQCDGLPPGGGDARPGLCGAQGGRHDAADRAVGGQRAGAPRATRLRCIDKDEVRACGLQPAAQGSEIALARPDVATGDALGVRFLGDVSDGNGLFLPLSPDGAWARLVHG